MKITNKIVLGTVQFGLKYGINNNSGKPDEVAVKSILDLAFDNNIHILDTAEIYGNSQEVIGNYHKSSRNRFKIISKFCSSRNDLPENPTKRILHNLKTLQIDSLYCYMFNSFADFETYFYLYKNEIRQLKKTGVINRFGVSIYANNEIEEVLKCKDVDLIQFPFNLLDNSNQRINVLKKAKERGVEIHTRSTFLQGLFFMNPQKFPVKIVALKPYIETINKISAKNHVDLNSLSLNYVTHQKNVDKVLIGVDTVEQLRGNLNALQKNISTEVFKQIDTINVKETHLLNPNSWHS